MGKYWLAEIDGIADRDAALALNGTKLWIDRDALPETDEGEFYIEDLIGLDVIDTDGKSVGKVIAVDNFGAGDLMEIKPAAGSSFYVPFSNDFVPDISLENRKITIIPQDQEDV